MSILIAVYVMYKNIIFYIKSKLSEFEKFKGLFFSFKADCFLRYLWIGDC